MNKKVLVIVAHPDDETIWMGGTLLSNINNWDLTIISLCRRNDKDRVSKFKKVCKILKAKCFISDLEDEKLNDIPTEEITKRIKRHLDGNYDYIFTHGKNGEYGHKRHIQINNAVVEMLKEKKLPAKKIFFFSYLKKWGRCYPNKNSDKFTKLRDIHFERKKELIQDVYGFKKTSFEFLCCRDTEAFRIKIIT
ncbi:MAG: PIG-L family deacetylase [Candidatus Omnitrophica bacterium]|nr:PIG-L family deacetylase [Candidatus Omnitrophota bacterium]